MPRPTCAYHGHRVKVTMPRVTPTVLEIPCAPVIFIAITRTKFVDLRIMFDHLRRLSIYHCRQCPEWLRVKIKKNGPLWSYVFEISPVCTGEELFLKMHHPSAGLSVTVSTQDKLSARTIAKFWQWVWEQITANSLYNTVFMHIR